MKKFQKNMLSARMALMQSFFVSALFLLTLSNLRAQTLYTWVSDNPGKWTDPDNWTPRGIPGADAVVRFNHESFIQVTDVPAGTNLVGLISEGKGITFLEVDKPMAEIKIGYEGEAASVFRILEGSTLYFSGSNDSKWIIDVGVEVAIRGTLGLLGGETGFANHAIQPLGLPGVIFEKGSRFVIGNSSNRLDGYPIADYESETPLVIFKAGATLVQADGKDPFGPTLQKPLIVFEPGSTYEYADNTSDNLPAFLGRSYPNFIYACFDEKMVKGRGSVSFENLEIRSGVLNFNFDGGNANNINITGSIKLKDVEFNPAEPSLVLSPATGFCRLNLMGKDTQVIKGLSTVVLSGRAQMLVSTGAMVELHSNVTTGRSLISGGGDVVVQENAYLGLVDEAKILGAGRFFMRSTAILGIGSKFGITSKSDSGNVQTTNRVYGQGTYRYIGKVTQQTGDGLLNWNNSVPMPQLVIATQNNAVVELTASRRMGTLILESGSFSTNGFNLSLRGLTTGGPNGGPVPALLRGGQKAHLLRDEKGGAILFEGIARVEAIDRFNISNVIIGAGVGSGVDFGETGEPVITGWLMIQNPASQVKNPPAYATGSTLIYAAANTVFNCGPEWQPNLDRGRGVPHHVQVGAPGLSGTQLAFTGAGQYWHNEGLMTFRGTQPGLRVNSGVNLNVGPLPINATGN